MPHPTAVAPAPEGDLPLNRITRSSAELQPQTGVTLSRIRTVLERTMPELLREATGEPLTLWFVADAEGRVVHAEQRRLGGRYAFESFTAEGVDPKTGETRFTARRVEAADDASQLTPGLDPDAIASVEVLKLAPGRLTVDSAAVIWVQLEPGATMGDARQGRMLLRGSRAVEGRPSASGGTLRRRANPAAVVETVTVDPAEARGRRSTTYSRDSATGRFTFERRGATADTVRLAPSARGGTARITTEPATGAVRVAPLGRDVFVADRIRLGTGKAGPDPLYVIDDERVDDGDERLRRLDPKEIDSIEVLKGAAATSLYGPLAKDGVIRIVTKGAAATDPVRVLARPVPPR